MWKASWNIDGILKARGRIVAGGCCINPRLAAVTVAEPTVSVSQLVRRGRGEGGRRGGGKDERKGGELIMNLFVDG